MGTAGPRGDEVDPERVLLLDVNYTNNSWTLRPETAEAARSGPLHGSCGCRTRC